MESLIALSHRTFSSLKIRNYRLYFIGQGISLSGTWMGVVALGWLVLQLTGSGAQLGLVTALQFIPTLFLGPWGGVIVDRFPKYKMFFWTQATLAALSLMMSILILSHLTQLWMVYVFAFIFGIIRIFDDSARQSFLFEMVGPENLKNAVSLSASENNLGRAIGPSVAGILIVGVGIGFCFLFNALSYLAVLFVLAMMRKEDFHAVHASPKTPGQLLEGLRYIWSNPLIKKTLLLMSIIGAFTFEFQVSLPLMSQQIFSAGAPGYGALFAAMGVGSVVGGLYSAGRHKVAHHHLVVFMFLFGASVVAASLMPSLVLSIVAMLVVGFFSINVTSLANTMIQLDCAPHMRGRVMALWNVAMIGSTPIGAPIVGFVGEFIGARWGLGIGGVAAILTGAIAIRALLKKDLLQSVPESVELETERSVI
ncbi:MFS transporter [Candidatus Kaiserbacteria bacterium]|nr:MFS transporter [Candidatus Kaiserbacteria bacterium]